ncbi:class I SAM-dependent DNA methyltransferase [Geodermatophilus sp. SYSU D00742]
MPSFDSIVVSEEWISEHYLTTDARSGSFLGQVNALRTAWDEEEEAGRASSRSRLQKAATTIARATSTLTADDTDAAGELHAVVREALGYAGKPEEWTTTRGAAEVTVPGAVVLRGSAGVSLVILEARPAQSVEDVLDATGAGRLLAAATLDGAPVAATSKVVSELFHSDDAPPFILVLAGRWALLAERTRWPEGRWLAVDLGLVAERRDTRRARELDHAVALLGRDTVLPRPDGSTLWADILAESVQHTVGVSKDLREGIRLSVEIIANEVVRRRRAEGLPIEGEPALARDLTRQSLRFLYRILFVLYAETSTELGVLPVTDPQYRAGYGIDRLRDLTLTQLTTDRAKHGTHLYESLALLFRLIDRGHEVAADASGRGLAFRSLRADLFGQRATALIDEVKLGNDAVQHVLSHLLLSKAKKGGDRGFISYAELGINQLGAVYEGLMSYTGFFAEEDLYEVAPNGNPEKGTWVLPVTRADDVDPEHLVRTPDPITGEPKPVLHRRGTFVYRLAGRERQQSASYYTPEVLTRSVVHHSLEELLDQNDTKTPAADVLRLTICEPALGSGAFAIEAVRQLADRYLKRRQEEVGEQIPADRYPTEMQKVKAYLALHQVYGVDLNETAVELAEVSLWLDTMDPSLQAPWFGLHLRRGNSLIGARRAFYSPNRDLPKKAWLATVPEAVPLCTLVDGSVDVSGRIHHFLLPAQGWGTGADTAEAKQYAPEARERLREWQKDVRTPPSKPDQARLVSLARRVEKLWQLTLRRLTIAESEIRRHIEVWGAKDLPEATGAVSREQIEAVLNDPEGAYRRLRRVMDAWCALWFWPLTDRRTLDGQRIQPPSWQDWLGALESILGLEGKAPTGKRFTVGQIEISDETSWDELDQAEELEIGFAGARSSDWATERYPWLQVADELAAQQGFFHWELDFAPVFASGGFDLQVGNPPWVRPRWDEAAALADNDPWWQVGAKPSESAKATRRARSLSAKGALNRFLDERATLAGINEHLGSDVDRPVLTGLQPDLYRCFMERTWRSMSPTGIVGLIHPESHFTESAAGLLRRETYHRLRRHWQFRNEMKLFAEINDTRQYGLHIYGAKQAAVTFKQATWLYHPDTIDRSMKHKGGGEEPGIKSADGHWDTSPHLGRIQTVTIEVLRSWARLLEEASVPATETRMLYPVNRSSAAALDRLAASTRLGAVEVQWTRGWEEDQDRKRGFFVARSATPPNWSDVVLQGPHLSVATPLFKQPNPTAKHQQDYTAINLEEISVDFIPRTNYQRAVSSEDFHANYPRWSGVSSSEQFRLAWRRRVDPATVRSLHAALIPPGPTHVHQMQSLTLPSHVDLVVAAGFWASIILDFQIKVAGVADATIGVISHLPHIQGHPLEHELMLRTLRLNALTKEYAPLWEELYSPIWRNDRWCAGVGAAGADYVAIGDVGHDWSWDTALRRDSDRRRALVEIDSIVAVMLGITADELATIYRTQFPVLQSYEREALFDNNGRQVPREVVKAYRASSGTLPEAARMLDGKVYGLPFTAVDRETDLRAAHAHFAAIAADAMSEDGRR